jgi:hypothetical protein
MNKTVLTLFSAALILGASTSAFAEETNEGKGTFNFGKMKAMMQEMHPGMTDDELKEMYNQCHGTNGAMPSKNFKEMNHSNMDMMN